VVAVHRGLENELLERARLCLHSHWRAPDLATRGSRSTNERTPLWAPSIRTHSTLHRSCTKSPPLVWRAGLATFDVASELEASRCVPCGSYATTIIGTVPLLLPE